MTISKFGSLWIMILASSVFLACAPVNTTDVISPKYLLSDCLVQIDYLWPGETSTETRSNVDFAVFEQFKELIVSGEYPLFAAHSANGASYLRLYFADRCEDRLELTKRMANHLSEKVIEFPDHIVRTEGIEAGDDGTIPSGWWLDD